MKRWLLIFLCISLVLPTVLPTVLLTVSADKGENIALGKPTRANGNNAQSYCVTDGSVDTSWTGTSFPQFVDVDLMDNYDISEVIVYMPTSHEYTYTVYGSLDGVNFARIADSNERKSDSLDEGNFFTLDTPKNYRVIRVNVTSTVLNGKASICEIEVYGKKNNSAVIKTRDKLEFTSYDEWLLDKYGVDIDSFKDENGKYDIEDTYTEHDTIDALEGLVTRILGSEYVDWFVFTIDDNKTSGKDFYEISSTKNGKIAIRGNDGVAIASGLNYFLKYYCRVNVSQQTKQTKMPKSIPVIEQAIHKETDCEVRYAYNFCTLSYTMQFYGFDEWQRELDYLMLNGVNVILDTTASEALWVMYLQRYGYTANEAIDYVCGYAYKAWWLMGNIEGFGGNVGDQWIYDTLEMARINQRYMTVMGCMPCLNIFAGTLPANFSKKADATLTDMGYPNIANHITGTGLWSGFSRPYSLNSTFSGFERMSADFYEVQNHLYGRVTDYYAGDFLHELAPALVPPSFNKAAFSRAVLNHLINENEDACWIMQAWEGNPLPEVVAGFGEDREKHVLMLDLAASNATRWNNTENYGGFEFGGTSWVFCMLDNFGGRTGMHGAFENIMNRIFDAYEGASHFKGIGITPEGTEENPASYDFYWELIWVSPNDVPAGQDRRTFVKNYVAKWIDEYSVRRYGSESDNIRQAWRILGETVYGTKTINAAGINTIFGKYPILLANGSNTAHYASPYYRPPYNAESLEKALGLLMMEYDNLKSEETYIYDLCDVMNQVLINSSSVYYTEMVKGLVYNDFNRFRSYKNKFIRCIELIDEVSSHVSDTTLRNWVGRVDNWVNDDRTGEYSDYDIDTMKHNALMLITTWATHDELIGYANRCYSGLLNDYYARIWGHYLEKTELASLNGICTIPKDDKALYFEYAWDIIASRGEKYTNSDSSAVVRDLKDIYAEISDRYLKSSGQLINNILLADVDSGLTVQDKKLLGATNAMTAGFISEAFKGDTEGTIVVYDSNGIMLSAEERLSDGCKVVLLDKYGAKCDFINVEAVEIVEIIEDSSDVESSLDENVTAESSEIESSDANSDEAESNEIETSAEKSENSFPAVPIVIGVIVLVVTAAAVFVIIQKRRK